MKEETKNKIAALTFENLSAELDGFTLKKTFTVDEDKFIFFTYADEITIENEPGLIWSIGGESSGEFDSATVRALKNGLRIRGIKK